MALTTFGFTTISPNTFTLVDPAPPVTGLPPGLSASSTVGVNKPSTYVVNYPLQDIGPNLSEQTLNRTIVDHYLNIVPTITEPQGSSGPGIYKDIGMTSPLSASMHRAIPNQAVQKLLGMNLNQLQRIEGWVTKLLHLVHSHNSPSPNSDLNLLLSVLPGNLKNAVNRYAQLLQQSGNYASDVAKTYTTDYAQGNSLIQSNAVHQINAGQHRIQTSSVFDVNSPSVNFAAQHGTIQLRFEHHLGDMYQGTHVQHFTRAEDKLTQMAANAIQYSSNEHAQYAANLQQVSGSKVSYSDTEWSQVGQTSQTPVSQHTDLSRTNATYGKSTKVVQKDYHLSTNTGEVVVNSGTNLQLAAKTGDVRVSSSSGNVGLTSTKQVTVYGNDTNTYGQNTASLGGQTVFVTASSTVFVKGSMVFINCGGTSGVAAPLPAKIINPTPKEFTPMIDPMPLIKDNPVSPGPVAQSVPATPEPGSTPGGPDNLGSFLTK